MREIRRIVVHHSASAWGDAKVIDEWHRARGFNSIGYHAVVLNGQRSRGAEYVEVDDGAIEYGRPIEEEGAHAAGHNGYTLGACLVGNKAYTGRQLEAAARLVADWLHTFGLTSDDVVGHGELNGETVCPELPMGLFRRLVASYFSAP